MKQTTALANQIIESYTAKRLKIATAESCTGGMIAAALTDIAGSSSVVDRGFVTYSNQAKIDMLGVLEETLQTHGAVSEETACEMAKGALLNSNADVAVSVTGIAGPGGGTSDKPIGLVYMAIATKDEVRAYRSLFGENKNRGEIREATVAHALAELASL